jgi:hypothetical protein
MCVSTMIPCDSLRPCHLSSVLAAQPPPHYCHRNHAAVSDTLLGTSISSTVNPFWLHLDASFLEAHPGAWRDFTPSPCDAIKATGRLCPRIPKHRRFGDAA